MRSQPSLVPGSEIGLRATLDMRAWARCIRLTFLTAAVIVVATAFGGCVDPFGWQGPATAFGGYVDPFGWSAPIA